MVITFHVRRIAEAIGRGRLRVCVSVCLCVCPSLHFPTLMHGPGCKLGEWYGVPSSCALLAFAIGARVSLL